MRYTAAAALFLLALAAARPVLAHSDEHGEEIPSIDCRNPPADAVTVLPAPLDRWARLECTPGAQFIVPHAGWIWRYPASFTTPVMVPAWTPNPARAAAAAHYFVSLRLEHLPADAANALHGRMAAAVPNYGAMAEAPLQDVYSLRAENNHGEQFEIHFMYRSDADVWALVCAPDCGPEMSFLISSRSQ